MRCDARIRPMPNTTEIRCTLKDDGHERHEGDLRDYAYPGSLTVVYWLDDDRRNFRGDWVECPATPGCLLPANHGGRCAL